MEVRSKTIIKSFTTSATRGVLYTCPPKARAKIPLVFIVNANGTVSVTLEIYKADVDDHFFVLSGKNLAGSEYLQLSDSYIVLEAGDKIEVTPTGTDPIVDALCTVEEQFIANQGT